MTHSIDFEGVEEKLFLIQNLVLGSIAYCVQHKIGRNIHPYGAATWSKYSWRLQPIISTYAIECAVKTRIVQDFVRGSKENIDLAAVDEEARNGSGLGIVFSGNMNLTVRESCNKIIHATKVDLSWSKLDVQGTSNAIEYWTGGYNLYGTHGKHSWHVELDMLAWAIAMENFHSILEERVDWYDVYDL